MHPSDYAVLQWAHCTFKKTCLCTSCTLLKGRLCCTSFLWSAYVNWYNGKHHLRPSVLPPCSQQSYFYHQLACFLRPFAASPNASVYTPALRDPSLNGQLRKRLAGDCEHFECRGRNDTFCCAMGKGAWCLPLLGGARVCHVRANRLEQFLDRVLPHFGLLGAKRRDYVVLNAGLW